MNEKVSISDINIPNNFKDIRTNYNITLYDKDTGEIVYSTDGHNKLNPNIGLRPWTYTYGTMLLSNCAVSPFDSSTYELPSGLYFFNSQDDPSTNHIAGPQRGTYLGAGRVNESNSAAGRCSYNPNESKYEIVYEEDGIAYIHKHMVFDATTSQLNGEINTVVLGAHRYMDVRGVYESNIMFRNVGNHTSSLYAHNLPVYGYNASLMSYHPDKPVWQTSQGYDNYILGTWSIESDNTAWFCPYRDSKISSPDDIVLFRYDLKAWKVLDVIKLSLPEECIGKKLLTYKFDDCIMAYPYNPGSYTENTNGTVQYSSSSMYKFNMNGDFVESIGRSLNLMLLSRFLVYDNKLYHWTGTSTTSYRAFVIFDAELNVLDGFKIADYMDDSRFAQSPANGPYMQNLAPTFILDNITGEHILTFNGHSASSSSYYGDSNLAWNIDKGRVEWLPDNNIYKFLYNRAAFANGGRLVCIIDGLPLLLPTGGYSGTYWPFEWYHWCKLPSPVTKTANTTMKVQIDLYYPIVNPFAFAAPPDTEASSTES